MEENSLRTSEGYNLRSWKGEQREASRNNKVLAASSKIARMRIAPHFPRWLCIIYCYISSA